MNTRNLSTILLLFLCFSLIAQEEDTKSTSSDLKLNLGATFTKYRFNDSGEEVEYKSQIGFRLGADKELWSKDRFNVEAGASFSLIRTKIDEPAVTYNTWYLGINVMPGYEILEDKLVLGVGPFLGYGLFGTQKFEGGESYDLFVGEDGNDPPLNRLNYGVDFRFLGNLPISSLNMQAYVSYRLGLPNIEGADSDNDQSTKVGTLTIGVRANLHELFGKK